MGVSGVGRDVDDRADSRLTNRRSRIWTWLIVIAAVALAVVVLLSFDINKIVIAVMDWGEEQLDQLRWSWAQIKR